MQNISDRHITLANIRHVQELCSPLTKYLNIHRFCYHKIFPNGQEIFFSNDSTWTTYVHKHNITMGMKLTALENPSFKTLLWPFENMLKGYAAVREIWDCHYGLDLSNQRNEFFGFASHDKDIGAINNYINNLEELERFCKFFTEQVKDLIQQASKRMILQHHQTKPKKIISLKENFIKETTLKNYSSLSKYGKEFKLSIRETDCLKLLMRGHTTEETSIALGLSKRTVETHLENIKNKTGTNNKNDLIKLIFDDTAQKFL